MKNIEEEIKNSWFLSGMGIEKTLRNNGFRVNFKCVDGLSGATLLGLWKGRKCIDSSYSYSLEDVSNILKTWGVI